MTHLPEYNVATSDYDCTVIDRCSAREFAMLHKAVLRLLRPRPPLMDHSISFGS
jgi:hypothetical protein